MGCVASRLEGEEEVVSICRERKRLIKLAVERRYALADAHCRYHHSLYAVSAAIELFVARHSNTCSPYLITFSNPNSSSSSPTPLPELESVISNPMFLQQNPSQPTTTTQEAILPSSCETPVSCSSSSSEENAHGEEDGNVVNGYDRYNHHHHQQEQQQQGNGYYYMGTPMPMPAPMPSPQRYFGWDFFNPLAGDVMNGGFWPNSDDGFRTVREEEGIPDLEEEGGGAEFEGKRGKEQLVVDNENHGENTGNVNLENAVGNGGVDAIKANVDNDNLKVQEDNGLRVMEKPVEVGVGVGVEGRELLDALRDIEDHFIRAYDSGKEVSRMLEANKMHMQSGLEEIKENSTKLIQSITWQRSNTSRSSSSSSSCKSILGESSSKNSTTSSWIEYKNDLFDDYGGMTAGSHSLTLGRLYAWERKLYDEVKAGDSIRKLYQKKCAHLRNKDVKGEDALSVDKTKAAVRDLYSRILVAIRRAESISDKIQKLADEELQPQILELLQGLAENWRIMMDAHETQNHIIFEVKSFDSPTIGKFCNDSHRLATLQLQAEIQNWQECFSEYVAAQRSYVEALHGWLFKFLVPENEFGSTRRTLAPPSYRANGPPLYLICHDWLTAMENLPNQAVSVAMRCFARDVRALWVQQGEEKDQKRKVDKMSQELEKKTITYQKVEGRIVHETKLLEYHKSSEMDSEGRDNEAQPQREYLLEKRGALDNLRKRLELEKEKHHNHMQATQRITLNGFQTGFSLIFDSLAQFSTGSLRMYNTLVNNSRNLDKDGKPTSLQEESSQDINS